MTKETEQLKDACIALKAEYDAKLQQLITKLKPDLDTKIRNRHSALSLIPDEGINLSKEGISFFADGNAYGYFKEDFYLPWKHFNINR